VQRDLGSADLQRRLARGGIENLEVFLLVSFGRVVSASGLTPRIERNFSLMHSVTGSSETWLPGTMARGLRRGTSGAAGSTLRDIVRS